jgi:hypothetical protein
MDLADDIENGALLVDADGAGSADALAHGPRPAGRQFVEPGTAGVVPVQPQIARPPVRLSAAFNKALRSPHVIVTGIGGLSVGTPPGCGVGSCAAVGACAMHPPPANKQTSAARQPPDRTALIEPPLWRALVRRPILNATNRIGLSALTAMRVSSLDLTGIA